LIRAALGEELLLEGVILSDLERPDQVLEKYSDANIGLVDATVVAIAERLGIRIVVTTDRRHFSLFRPKHCRAFGLLR
jgi:predicted nucleic acid-binding protein